MLFFFNCYFYLDIDDVYLIVNNVNIVMSVFWVVCLLVVCLFFILVSLIISCFYDM